MHKVLQMYTVMRRYRRYMPFRMKIKYPAAGDKWNINMAEYWILDKHWLYFVVLFR